MAKRNEPADEALLTSYENVAGDTAGEAADAETKEQIHEAYRTDGEDEGSNEG